MSNLNASGGGLRYRGTNAPQPPNCNFHPRDPNDFDRFGYSLLDMWLNTETEVIWFLADLSGTSTSGGIRAHWVTWGGPSAVGVLFTQGNDGISVFPDISGKINFIGIDPMFVAASGANTEEITVATATTSQIGVTTLATDALTIAGSSTTTVNTPASLKAKLGAQTTNGLPYGQGQTAAIAWTSAGTDGQIPIAATGGAPAFATIVSGDNSITFIKGANSLDMRAAVAGGSSIKITPYDTPGTHAFTKDARAKKIEIWGWAGGGGGSSRGASGSAGGTFHYSFPSFFVDDAPTTIEVVIGAGGAGGTGIPGAGLPGGASWFGNFTTGNNNTTGINQSVNNSSTSGAVLTEGGPSFPADGASSGLGTRIVGTTGTIMGWFSGVEGPASGLTRDANDGATGGTDTVNNFLGAMLGGVGGGGGSTTTAWPAGGTGGGIRNRRTLSLILAGGAGGAVGISGSPGNDSYPAPAGLNFLTSGTGGGGGGSGNTTGGAGGFPGGGGGGGGGSFGGVATGGAGGDGMIIVMEFLSD